MTRCSCSKNVCRPSTSFFYKVLSSLKQLQTQKKYGNGAGLEDITKFIDKTYNLTGDLHSQVENALRTAESCRFIIKKKNLYALLSPVATLQFTPTPCIKAKLERIQEVFNSKWCEESGTKKLSSCRSRKNSHSPLHFIPPSEASQQININKSISKVLTKKTSEPKSTRKLRSEKSVPDTSTCSQPIKRLRSSLASYLKSPFTSCVCNPSSSKGKVPNRSSSTLSSKENVSTPSSSQVQSKTVKRSASSSRKSFKKTRSSSSTCADSPKKTKRGDSSSQSRKRKKRRSHITKKSPRKKKGRLNPCVSSNENVSNHRASNQNVSVSSDDSDSESSEC